MFSYISGIPSRSLSFISSMSEIPSPSASGSIQLLIPSPSKSPSQLYKSSILGGMKSSFTRSFQKSISARSEMPSPSISKSLGSNPIDSSYSSDNPSPSLSLKGGSGIPSPSRSISANGFFSMLEALERKGE